VPPQVQLVMSPFSATATTATAGSIAVGTAQHGQRRQQAGGNFAAKPIRMAGWPSREGTFGPGQVVSPEESGWRTTIEGERDVMADTRRLERLTAQDLMTLWWDDFGWPGDIGALAILDGPALLDGDGRVPIEAIRRRLEPRLQLVPRFRQRLYRPRRGLGWPLWVDAPSFDLADRVRVFPPPAPADQAQLLAACEQLRRRHLDPARPLWEVWFLPGLPQQRLGLFLRARHAMADGVAGVAAFGALLDLAPDAPVSVARPWTAAPVPSAGDLLHDNLRRRVQGLDCALSGRSLPGEACGGPAPDHERQNERVDHQAENRWRVEVDDEQQRGRQLG
jgi:hypothetical protein